MVSVLFVCLGNICRSPAAEGILRHLNEKNQPPLDLHVESCGIGSWHIGKLPVEEMRRASEERGIILSSRAQQFQHDFFNRFDYILAADHSVLNELFRYADKLEYKPKIHLITEFSSQYFREEIPDPFCRGEPAFELVLDMLEDSCKGLLVRISH